MYAPVSDTGVEGHIRTGSLRNRALRLLGVGGVLTIVVCTACVGVAFCQVTAGSILKYDHKGAPDPLTGSWFESLDSSEAEIHYGSYAIPDRVLGRLFSSYFNVEYDVTFEYGENISQNASRYLASMRLVRFKEGTGLCFDAGTRRWLLFSGGHAVESETDIVGSAVVGYAEFLDSTSSGYVNSLVSGAGDEGNWKLTHSNEETDFGSIVFRRGGDGRLVMGLVTVAGARVSLPPMVANLTPGILGEFVNTASYDTRRVALADFNANPWPYHSCTDVTLSRGPRGSLLAQGRMEFVLLGWLMLLPNFGPGSIVRIEEDACPVSLVSGDGTKVQVESAGRFRFSGTKWARLGVDK
jgi:hypothetical protein